MSKTTTTTATPRRPAAAAVLTAEKLGPCRERHGAPTADALAALPETEIRKLARALDVPINKLSENTRAALANRLIDRGAILHLKLTLRVPRENKRR